MKVLLVEDQPEVVDGIKYYCEDNGWECEVVSFEDAFTTVVTFDPDVIVMDWFDGRALDGKRGEFLLNQIWKNCFRPIAVFSGYTEVLKGDDGIQSKGARSSMFRLIDKGSDTPVVEFLDEMSAFAPALAKFRDDMSDALISSLNAIDRIKTIASGQDNAVGYVLSQRAAAFFEDEYVGNVSPSWVQYLCPPVNEGLCVCDILRVKAKETDFASAGKPEEYRMILTPSCDMQKTERRNPKVTHALCACCEPKEDFYEGISLKAKNNPHQRVTSMLNRGYNENKVPLPEFPNTLPYMTADLKKLSLVPLDKITLQIPLPKDKNQQALEHSEQAQEFVRVASIASPFREQIVWAYLQNACRPGVPDRDTQSWAGEILKT